MNQTAAHIDNAEAMSTRLLIALAEQLKVPITQISRQAELAEIAHGAADIANIQSIRQTAYSAMQLVDNFLLSLQLREQGQSEIAGEPVAVSSVLYDAAHELQPFAKAYDVAIDLQLEGRYAPVVSSRQGLQAALVSLGYSLIEALPASDQTSLRLQLSAHRCRYGIVAGLYCDVPGLGAEMLRQGRRLYGRARQPLTALTPGSGAGIFIADSILQSLKTPLITSRHNKLRGLGAILQPNPQLHLV